MLGMIYYYSQCAIQYVLLQQEINLCVWLDITCIQSVSAT